MLFCFLISVEEKKRWNSPNRTTIPLHTVVSKRTVNPPNKRPLVSSGCYNPVLRSPRSSVLVLQTGSRDLGPAVTTEVVVALKPNQNLTTDQFPRAPSFLLKLAHQLYSESIFVDSRDLILSVVICFSFLSDTSLVC